MSAVAVLVVLKEDVYRIASGLKVQILFYPGFIYLSTRGRLKLKSLRAFASEQGYTSLFVAKPPELKSNLNSSFIRMRG